MTTATYAEKALATRPPLVTRPLLMRFAVTLGASISFYLLLSVVPLYASSAGAGGNAAGLATGALMFATVAGELVTPRLTARYGYRMALAAGLVLLGAPALALTASASLALVTAVCIVRGLGFAITVVAGGAITASLIPAERRGEGLALAGVVSGVPALTALPLGVWLAGRIGAAPVFAAGAGAALAALAALPGLPGKSGGRPAAPHRGRAADRRPAASGHRVRGHHRRGRDHRHLRAARGDRVRRRRRAGAVRPVRGGHREPLPGGPAWRPARPGAAARPRAGRGLAGD